MKTGNTIWAQHSPWIYFLIAIGVSWLFWVPAAFIRENIFETPWIILLYAGGVGPAVGGILLTYLSKDQDNRRGYWRRALDFKRIRGKWYMLILFAYPLITLLLSITANGQIQITETFEELLTQPLRMILFAIGIFIFGPLPEELGWRGVALGGLQKRMNAVAASLWLGMIWAAWHIPLFFIQGTYQNILGFGTAAFWRFMAFAVVISIFFTWIYNNNRSSTLSAMLFHFSVNFTGNVFEVTENLELYRIISLVMLAVIVIAFYGAKDLANRPRRSSCTNV